jgi:hypothetical protein
MPRDGRNQPATLQLSGEISSDGTFPFYELGSGRYARVLLGCKGDNIFPMGCLLYFLSTSGREAEHALAVLGNPVSLERLGKL